MALVFISAMSQGHHAEAVERMERIGAILADVFLVRREILRRSGSCPAWGLHVVMLEHVVSSQIRPAFVVEVAVADAGHDEHAAVGQDALRRMTCAEKRLHHLNRVGALPLP